MEIKTLARLGYKRFETTNYVFWYKKIENGKERRIEFDGENWCVYEVYTADWIVVECTFLEEEKLAIKTYNKKYKKQFYKE